MLLHMVRWRPFGNQSHAARSSASYACSAPLLCQLEKPDLDPREQTRRNEAVAEYPGASGNPARLVIEPDRLANSRRHLDSDGIAERRGMSDRQDDDKTRVRGRIAGSHQTGRSILALTYAGGSIAMPQIVIADDQTGLRLR